MACSRRLIRLFAKDGIGGSIRITGLSEPPRALLFKYGGETLGMIARVCQIQALLNAGNTVRGLSAMNFRVATVAETVGSTMAFRSSPTLWRGVATLILSRDKALARDG